MLISPIQVAIKTSSQQIVAALEAARTIREAHPDASINIEVDCDREPIPLDPQQ